MSHRGINVSSPAATMTSVQTLRDFINHRLATAAGQIFTVFQQTIVQCEEKIVRQGKLLQITTQIKFDRTESPRQHVDHQKTSSHLEQKEHEAPHIKEEEDVVEVTVTEGENENENSLDFVRDLITQGLAAAAQEILTVLEQTILQYEDEIDRQRRLLEIIFKPQIKLHRTELPKRHDCTEEQLFKQEINYRRKQEEPEPPQIKEEPEPLQIEEQQDLCSSQEGEQLVLKAESDSFRVLCIEEQSYLSQSVVQDTEQLLSHDSDDVKHLNSESTRNADLNTISMFNSHYVNNVPVSEKQAEGEKLLYKETCGIVRKKHKLCQNVGTVTNNKKKIVCEICGECYSRRCELLVHISTHTGERPFTCATCDKSFTRPCNLFVHMRTHTGEKPYSCGTCGKSFSVHSTLFRHMRTHTGEKPYPCETCGKSFSQHGNLLLHMRTHTGEKPYSCVICGKSFCRQDNFLRHMKAHKEMKT